MEIPSKSFAQSSLSVGTKNAWARYVRRRWRASTLAMIQAEWDLTEGEARGVLYAQASQSTIDKILRHERGGFGLGLEILAHVTGETLEQFIERQALEARHEQSQHEARERHLAALSARLSGGRGVGRHGP